LSNSNTKTLIVFAKAPVQGQVKTRLIPEIGADAATRVYRKLLEQILDISVDLPDVTGELWCSGDIDGKCAAYAKQHGMSLHQQEGADLGERMHLAFESVLQRCDRAVLIGSDSPEFDGDYLQAAFRALEEKDAVVGPAEDGGYLLIGLKKPEPHLFRQITWSTNTVMAQTRSRLNELSLSWHELPVKRDIDEPQDLAQFPQLFSD